uniref:cytokinin riboside 5'-monophosphate phosphoribohydrolase n=1 Tax=Aegilops tauschii TaxID=37682 RepID=R7W744_AEGTA
MGLVSQAVHSRGRQVTGFVPGNDGKNETESGRMCPFLGCQCSMISHSALPVQDDSHNPHAQRAHHYPSILIAPISVSKPSKQHYLSNCYILTATIFSKQIIGETAGEVKEVADMHQRKAEMGRQSDAFIALPGGYGTLEELLEVITWAQLRIHDKPAMEEGFIAPTARHIIVLGTTASELLDKLQEYSPRHGEMKGEVEQLSSRKNCDMDGLKEGSSQGPDAA